MNKSVLILFCVLLIFSCSRKLTREELKALNNNLIKETNNGNIKEVKKIIRKGADINAEDELNNMTALMNACYAGELEIVKYLIKKGADVNHKNFLNITLLMYASRGHQLEVVKYLINEQKVNVNEKSINGSTALFEASSASQYQYGSGSLEIVKYLIENGADINAEDEYGNNALFHVSKKGNLDITKYLVENGLKIDTKNNFNETALMFACSEEHYDIVKYLVEKGADVNAKTKFGRTVLMYASKGDGNIEIIKNYLQEKGIDTSELEYNSSSDPWYSDETKLKIIEYLKSKGAK